MIQSCRPSSPALAAVLLAVLLGGERGPGLSLGSIPASPPAGDPPGPLILMGSDSWDKEEAEVLSGEV